MKVITMIQLTDDEDKVDLRKLNDWCNMAKAFFLDEDSLTDIDRRVKGAIARGYNLSSSIANHLGVSVQQVEYSRESLWGGTHAVHRLSAGHPLTMEHVSEALREVCSAQVRLRKRKPDQFFPKELKDRYAENLEEAASMIQGWIDQTIPG